jgi:hypothetical protein
MIKVICIKEGHKELTYHKIYDAEFISEKNVIKLVTTGWALTGDYGWRVVFADSSGWVIPLAEWRQQQIDKILEDD